jgi:GNAT superfamily N-acetyltransferase
MRRAGTADLKTILYHRRRMFEDMGYTEPEALARAMASSAGLVERGLRQGTYHGWLAETADGTVVAGGGLLHLEYPSHPRDPEPRRTFVVNVFTEPEHRRRGLARRLMDEMIGWCREAGVRGLYLHASDEARPLYRELGFAPTNEMRLET